METFVGSTVRIKLDTHLDISGYSDLRIRYRKPDGSTGCWTGTVCPSDNECIYYDTDIIDLDIAGPWYVQAYAADTGIVRHGMWATFQVHNILGFCTEAPTTLPPTSLAPTTVP